MAVLVYSPGMAPLWGPRVARRLNGGLATADPRRCVERGAHCTACMPMRPSSPHPPSPPLPSLPLPSLLMHGRTLACCCCCRAAAAVLLCCCAAAPAGAGQILCHAAAHMLSHLDSAAPLPPLCLAAAQGCGGAASAEWAGPQGRGGLPGRGQGHEQIHSWQGGPPLPLPLQLSCSCCLLVAVGGGPERVPVAVGGPHSTGSSWFQALAGASARWLLHSPHARITAMHACLLRW